MLLTVKEGNRSTSDVSAQDALSLGYSSSAIAQAEAEARSGLAKRECRRRIYATASAETQMNMATAGAFFSSKTASARSESEKSVLSGIEASLAWVAKMRENVATLAADTELDIADDANWPECPDAALAVVGMF
jgi:hypothetical protein